jgi:hypothetical protein
LIARQSFGLLVEPRKQTRATKLKRETQEKRKSCPKKRLILFMNIIVKEKESSSEFPENRWSSPVAKAIPQMT